MPSGRGQQCRLTDLAAELIAKPVSLSEFSQPQRRDKAAAFRQTQVEQIATIALASAFGIVGTAQRLVQHDRYTHLMAQLGEGINLCVRDRLFNRRDAER